MYRWIVILLILCSGDPVKAQNGKFIFDHYGFSDGYSSLPARNIVKTKDGLVWITGSDGLARFDSKTFKFYRHHESDSNSIASNVTYNIVTDKQGKIWVQAGSGLDVFDPTTEKFKHCYLQSGNKIKKDFWANSLLYDSVNDRVWVGTEMGLYYSQRGSLRLQKARHSQMTEELISMNFEAMVMDADKNLWLGNNQGFYKYHPVSGTIEPFHIPNQDPLVENDDGILCMYMDKNEVLWLGAWTKGLVSFDTRSGRTSYYYYSDHTKENNAVIAINQTHLPDQKDLLWISAVNRGLGTFNTITKAFTFYNTVHEKDISGIKGLTNGLYPDVDDGMWIGAEQGLHKYDYARQGFKKIDLSSYNPYFAKTDPIDNFCFEKNNQDNKERAWITIPYLGAYIYDFTQRKLYPAPAVLNKYFKNRLTDLFATYIDRKNILWISTTTYGLTGYDINTGKLLTEGFSFFQKDWEWVTGFFEDKSGNLWLATYQGLFVMDTARKNCRPAIILNKELEEKKLPGYISSLCQDAAGKIWFVQQHNEYKSVFGYYDPQNETVKIFDQKENKIIPQAEEMFSIVYHDNHLYISSTDGLILADISKKEPVFTKLTQKEGLQHNVIQNLLVDADGYVWCSGLFGISCYKPGENAFINYSKEAYGLETTFHSQLIQSPHSQNIFITQTGSFSFFDPDAIIIQPKPAIIFNSLAIFDKQLLGYSQLLNNEVVKLRHDQNAVSIEFAALSYSNSVQNLYSWKLKGLENNWHYSYNNLASYNNLSPGTYTLFVKAANSSGVWTSEPVSLTFSIQPPFWKTWWFIALVIISVIAGLYGLYRYRIIQLLRMQKMRNIIGRNLHDEIGSTLTSISILSSVTQQAMEKNPAQAKDMLQKIAQQSKTIQQNMSDIVWAVRSDNDKVENLIVRMREYATQTLEPMNIRTNISINESLLNKVLVLQARKEVLLIFKEAVNNIAKHSGATAVNVSLQKQELHLLLEITDNGRWKGNGKTSGTGMISMQQRAVIAGGKLAVTHSEKGTTVLLTFPLT